MKTRASNWTNSACLLKALVNWLTFGWPLQLWIEIWNGAPASKLGTKHVMVGRPVDPLDDENSARHGVSCTPHQAQRSEPLTDIVHQVAVDAELLDGHDGIAREEEHVPVVVTHVGRARTKQDMQMDVGVN